MPLNAFAAAAALVLVPVTALATVPSVRSPPPSRPPDPAIVAARSPTVAAGPTTGRAASATGWRWPLSPRPFVRRPFEIGPHRWSRGHRGADLDARVGQPVLAPSAGVVTFTRRVVNRPILVITHLGGVRTAFEPVVATVPFGTPVLRGAVVGRVADSPGHCRPRTCLHWSARRGDRYVDPLAFLTTPRLALLPVPRVDR